jgi:hypothetical protein
VPVLAALLAGGTACQKMSGLHSYADKSEVGERIDRLVPAEAPASPEDQRKVIVNHDLSVEVRDFTAAYEAVVRLAGTQGGYAAATERYRTDEGTFRGRIVMRVPRGKADSALEQLRQLGTVIRESSSGEDITDQYDDLEARLRNSKASEARLLDLMGRQTGKLSDVLEVERELTRVRGDIESMEGRKRNWDLLTQTVAITVNLSEPPRGIPVIRNLWNPLRTAFPEAANYFVHSIRAGIILLGMALPWMVIAALVFTLARRSRRRRPAPPEVKP